MRAVGHCVVIFELDVVLIVSAHLLLLLVELLLVLLLLLLIARGADWRRRGAREVVLLAELLVLVLVQVLLVLEVEVGELRVGRGRRRVVRRVVLVDQGVEVVVLVLDDGRGRSLLLDADELVHELLLLLLRIRLRLAGRRVGHLMIGLLARRGLVVGGQSELRERRILLLVLDGLELRLLHRLAGRGCVRAELGRYGDGRHERRRVGERRRRRSRRRVVVVRVVVGARVGRRRVIVVHVVAVRVACGVVQHLVGFLLIELPVNA